MSQIILASASPRRKELLEQIGLEFEICPAKGEEIITKTVPEEVVMELSRQKALEIASMVATFGAENKEITTQPIRFVSMCDRIPIKIEDVFIYFYVFCPTQEDKT